MCGGAVGSFIKNPVKTTSNALSKLDDVARPVVMAPVEAAKSQVMAGKSLLEGDISGSLRNMADSVIQPARSVLDVGRELGDIAGLGKLTDKAADLGNAALDKLPGANRNTMAAASGPQAEAPAPAAKTVDQAAGDAASKALAWRTKRRRALSSLLFQAPSALGALNPRAPSVLGSYSGG